jgi:radical SAM-linked protein
MSMKLRMRFSKVGKVRFTSHRDLARMWERALRKAGLRAAYTAGFSPRPKIAFGLALPTGSESLAEYLDLELLAADDGADGTEDLLELPGRLSRELPVGIDVTAVAPLEAGSPSLQESVTSCSWKIEAVGVDVPTAARLASRAMEAETLVLTRSRKGREVTDDLRPALLHVSISGPTANGVELEAELGVHPRSLRPSELLRALSPDGGLREGRVLRTAQWTWHDGARREPLATSSPPREDLHVRDRIPWPHAPAADPRTGALQLEPEPPERVSLLGPASG